jgi:hypothetical protein
MNSNSSFKSTSNEFILNTSSHKGKQLAVEEFLKECDYKIKKPKAPIRLHKRTLTVLTEEELFGGDVEVNKFDCFITPKEEEKIQFYYNNHNNNNTNAKENSYFFLNSWQNNTINKIDLDYNITSKKLNYAMQSVCSKSTLRKAEDYLRYESSININFDEFEYEKLKLKWKENIEMVNSQAFSICGNSNIECKNINKYFPINSVFNIAVYNILMFILLVTVYVKSQIDSYLDKITQEPLFRYELIFHEHINDYIKYK